MGTSLDTITSWETKRRNLQGWRLRYWQRLRTTPFFSTNLLHISIYFRGKANQLNIKLELQKYFRNDNLSKIKKWSEEIMAISIGT